MGSEAVVTIHIYTAAMQPATRFIDPYMSAYLGKNHVIEWSGRTKVRCQCCGKLRLAKNAVVQCYYDSLVFWCAAGRGCKSEALIGANKRREFRNRSAGQRARWRKTGAE